MRVELAAINPNLARVLSRTTLRARKGAPMRQLHKLLSYTVIGLSLLLAMQLYVYAPWRVDPFAFLARPLILFVLPLFVAGIALRLTPSRNWPSYAYPLILIALGALSLVTLHQWPSQYTPTTWEDNYQALAALESGYLLVCVPFWFCVVMVVSPRVRRLVHQK